MAPPTPRAFPMSSQSVRIYVPLRAHLIVRSTYGRRTASTVALFRCAPVLPFAPRSVPSVPSRRADAVYLEGRVHRRDPGRMSPVKEETAERICSFVRPEASLFLNHISREVLRGRRDPEFQDGPTLSGLSGTRLWSSSHCRCRREGRRRPRIKGPGVTGSFSCGESPKLCHHVARGVARLLIDDEDSVTHARPQAVLRQGPRCGLRYPGTCYPSCSRRLLHVRRHQSSPRWRRHCRCPQARSRSPRSPWRMPCRTVAMIT